MPRTSTRARLPPARDSIQRFTRSSKPGTTLHPSTPSKKRKLSEIGNSQGGEEPQDSAETATPSKTLRFNSLSVSTPQNSQACSAPSRTPSLEPSTEPLEETTPPSSPSPTPASCDGDCGSRTDYSSTVPQLFDELIDLHSCFLTALSLHFAHNGPSAPADLRHFLPTIERIWKRRKVMTRDLQRLLWISGEETDLSAPCFRIANYGIGKICLERVVRDSKASKGSSCCLDEDALQGKFERILEKIWRRVADQNEAESSFERNLGFVPIHESLTPFTAMRMGRQRLQELRGNAAKVSLTKVKQKTENHSIKQSSENTSDRRKGLLDRIKDKEFCQSKLPPPPSKETLLRRSAAERVEEVARVLALMRPSNTTGKGARAKVMPQKKPFRVETLIQNIQDSIPSPICKKEAGICLEILAQKDIAGDWVNIVTVNQLKSVILKSVITVSPREIRARVAKMKIGWEDHSL
ncbi:hypothetical protein Egran_01613 [Elaphomyces granulatus]|uniref:DNA replication factor Cdt1 C-terminal domain-containing protein n=1 Tax=Elaphomyces granulatus TaxID=519963 RepID=A0A232M2J4_9EURO|nr:hypothetical protein Egran_01613 [Elaphomyces granulatus]